MDRSLNICKGGRGGPGGERIDCANLRVWLRQNIRQAHYMLTRNTKATQNRRKYWSKASKSEVRI